MPVVSNDFSDIVYNRRSIRNFDPSVKIPREELLEILDKTVTAPSSVNMQPWRFVVVDSEEGSCCFLYVLFKFRSCYLVKTSK